MMWVVAILTMVVGAVLAITQTDIKRMLAYSSIAHAGFLLTGVRRRAAALDDRPTARSPRSRRCCSTWSTYGFTTIGAFAVVTLVRDAGGEATHLSRWAGLGKESPLVAGVFAFFLLALAGIPLTSGLHRQVGGVRGGDGGRRVAGRRGRGAGQRRSRRSSTSGSSC